MCTPRLWASNQGHLHLNRVRREAATLAARHVLPATVIGWKKRAEYLRDNLRARFSIVEDRGSLSMENHGEIVGKSYTIQRVSFQSHKGVRVTGNLYVPRGDGPFPAVLNTHGHSSKGKIFPRFQSRCHILAQNGFVVLSTDAPGSGERGEHERIWTYHGSMRSAGLFMVGDSLLAWQVRDNMRAIDYLQALPFVDAKRIGVTGGSGGGNQAMWLAAVDERVKAAVPVVSVGSFEAYVGRCNCVCETLPHGLALAEEWEVLGLIAPRALLVLSAIHDQPAFCSAEANKTCQYTREVYSLLMGRSAFDFRLFEASHGYWPSMIEAMVGWMRHWLKDDPDAQPKDLPPWDEVNEDDLICYPRGKRPDVFYRFSENILQLARGRLLEKSSSCSPEESRRSRLREILSWNEPSAESTFVEKMSDGGLALGSVYSNRGIPLPLVIRESAEDNVKQSVRLILSPQGKNAAFVKEAWDEPAVVLAIAAVDLPGTGELSWDMSSPSDGSTFHDAARACMWLGYSLIGEWAECVTCVLHALHRRYPSCRMEIFAERESAFAALIAMALTPSLAAALHERDVPRSLWEFMGTTKGASHAWIVPEFLKWGDLEDLRELST